MNGTNGNGSVKPYDRVKVPSRSDLGIGEVLRIAEFAGVYQADVVFDLPEGRKLETIPSNSWNQPGTFGRDWRPVNLMTRKITGSNKWPLNSSIQIMAESSAPAG